MGMVDAIEDSGGAGASAEAEPLLRALEERFGDEDTHAFAMLMRRGLEAGLPRDGILRICGTYRDLMSKRRQGSDL